MFGFFSLYTDTHPRTHVQYKTHPHWYNTDDDVIDLPNPVFMAPYPLLRQHTGIYLNTFRWSTWMFIRVYPLHPPPFPLPPPLMLRSINVGCAYIRATHRAFAVVKRAADELAAEPGWDQQVGVE